MYVLETRSVLVRVLVLPSTWSVWSVAGSREVERERTQGCKSLDAGLFYLASLLAVPPRDEAVVECGGGGQHVSIDA